ncbi:MAG: 3-beta hydroxysteroid dehydrogenase [Opitutus sp.]|nr:3-beta hydroxysteroid dehydrogenase [Opitutus sp.]
MNGPAFITGASGFIGGQLAGRLLAAGRPVRVLARRDLPELAKLGARIVRGDLHDPAALRTGCEGAETVFHVAGRVGVWGPDEDFFHVNVEGTRHVVAACRAAHVPRLVYTSSPSVVFNGGDLAGVDESAPLCAAAPCAYPTSKAAAERLVAAANGRELATVALRPHLVWGPGDRHVVPRVLALARRGRLKIVGAGRNLVDCTHIANVVDAHLCAERALANCHLIGDGQTTRRADFRASEGESCHLIGDSAHGATARGGARDPRGKAYFITNGEPVVLWDWINELLRGVGIPEITRHVPLGTAYRAGAVLETLWRWLPLKGEPPMTRFVAKELATDHWFRIDAARRDLGYAPRVTMERGTAELIAHYRAEQPFY